MGWRETVVMDGLFGGVVLYHYLERYLGYLVAIAAVAGIIYTWPAAEDALTVAVMWVGGSLLIGIVVIGSAVLVGRLLRHAGHSPETVDLNPRCSKCRNRMEGVVPYGEVCTNEYCTEYLGEDGKKERLALWRSQRHQEDQ